VLGSQYQQHQRTNGIQPALGIDRLGRLVQHRTSHGGGAMRTRTMRNAAIAATLLLCAGAARADTITFVAQPDTAYTTATTLIPIAASEGSAIGSLSDGVLEIDFLSGGSPELMQVDQVSDSWSTWASPPATESATPTVLGSFDYDNEILYQFNRTVTTFGMELEPDDTANPHNITATFLLSGTPQATLTLSVNGNGGALLFAATGGSFDAVDVTSDVDFGSAEFRYELAPVVPEPSLAMPLAVLLAGFAATRAFRAAAACK